jgi:hypothetical protein
MKRMREIQRNVQMLSSPLFPLAVNNPALPYVPQRDAVGDLSESVRNLSMNSEHPPIQREGKNIGSGSDISIDIPAYFSDDDSKEPSISASNSPYTEIPVIFFLFYCSFP